MRGELLICVSFSWRKFLFSNRYDGRIGWNEPVFIVPTESISRDLPRNICFHYTKLFASLEKLIVLLLVQKRFPGGGGITVETGCYIAEQ
jgi:hypothetical protein